MYPERADADADADADEIDADLAREYRSEGDAAQFRLTAADWSELLVCDNGRSAGRCLAQDAGGVCLVPPVMAAEFEDDDIGTAAESLQVVRGRDRFFEECERTPDVVGPDRVAVSVHAMHLSAVRS
jgi:hypothetical protein